MSKIYNQYLVLKDEDKDKMYLFRCGNFYIFLNEDAYKINEVVSLKITYFANGAEKCGFPINRFDYYWHLFEEHNLPVELVGDREDDIEDYRWSKIKKILDKTVLEELTPLEAINQIARMKEIMNDE